MDNPIEPVLALVIVHINLACTKALPPLVILASRLGEAAETYLQ
jgi:hypothetical protein